MAKEYEARADALLNEQRPGTADWALSRPAPEAPPSSVQQQQQPQAASGGTDAPSPPSATEAPLIARCLLLPWAPVVTLGAQAALAARPKYFQAPEWLPTAPHAHLQLIDISAV
jgi:hypothetical protein